MLSGPVDLPGTSGKVRLLLAC